MKILFIGGTGTISMAITRDSNFLERLIFFFFYRYKYL